MYYVRFTALPDRLLPGCHTISPERIPCETCRGTETDAVSHSTAALHPLLTTTLTGHLFSYGTCFPATNPTTFPESARHPLRPRRRPAPPRHPDARLRRHRRGLRPYLY